MYDYSYNYGYGYDSYDYSSAANAAGGILLGGLFMWIIGMAIGVFFIIAMWKLFTKAGKKGWASLVPIYNIIVMLEIAELPMWYLALFLVPFANIYAMIKIYIEIAHKFGKSTGFGIGMVFLGIVFIPMLAFGKTEYKGINSTSFNNINSNNINSNMQNNQQVNISNNNFINNIQDVNSGITTQPINNINMQNNSSPFQPIGDVNNNVQSMNTNNISNTMDNTVPPMNNIENTINIPPVSGVNVQHVQGNSVSNNINQNNINSINNMNKTCPNCGTVMDYNAMFCTNCGHNM